MNSNGTTIVNFVSKNFKFLSDLIRIIHKEESNYITLEQMELLEKRYEISSETMIRYKIAKKMEDSYEINTNVVAFISFCNNEYALHSPAAVKKYHYSINELYHKLIKSDDKNNTIRYIEQLITEMKDFSDILFATAERLLQETLILKENIEQLSHKEKFDKATLIIKEFVEPLNAIVENNDNTIMSLIRDIKIWSLSALNNNDVNIALVLRRLWLVSESTSKDIELFADQILTELFSLRKIKKSSAIIAGAVSWLENYNQIKIKSCGEKYRMQVHKKNYFEETLEELEDISKNAITVIIPKETEIISRENTNFDMIKYSNLIKKSIPIENIYVWIYKSIDNITYKEYISALNVLNKIKISYTDNKDKVDFKDFKLEVPIANLNNYILKGD